MGSAVSNHGMEGESSFLCCVSISENVLFLPMNHLPTILAEESIYRMLN